MIISVIGGSDAKPEHIRLAEQSDKNWQEEESPWFVVVCRV